MPSTESQDESARQAASAALPDSLLGPYLRAHSPREAERALERLIADVVRPSVRAVVHRKWVGKSRIDSTPDSHVIEADDLIQEAVADVVANLTAGRPGAEPIRSVAAYATAIAERVCSAALRKVYAQRESLRNQIRYLLTHRTGLGLWQDRQGEWICGFAVWQVDERPADKTGRLQRIAGDRGNLTRRSLADRFLFPPAHGVRKAATSQTPVADLVEYLLRQVAAPVSFSALISSVAAALGVSEITVEPPPDPALGDIHEPQSPVDVARTVVDRSYLEQLWLQVAELAVEQRMALLLQAQDEQGRSVCVLASREGVARIPQIAELLELSADAFLDLWSRLPLEDLEIAALLRVDRQRVIDLRKLARKRLERRMTKWDDA